jgi:hypothetical protein
MQLPKQSKTKQNKTKQNKTKQNKTKQNKTKQNKHKTKQTQNKTKQKQNKNKTYQLIHLRQIKLVTKRKTKIFILREIFVRNRRFSEATEKEGNEFKKETKYFSMFIHLLIVLFVDCFIC